MIYMTNHDSLNTLLTQLDIQMKREKILRKVIDDLFIIICKKCSEEEIQDIRCLDCLQKLAKGELD